MKQMTTKKVNHTDCYFGTTIKDPYVWLEDNQSSKTKDWVMEQNNATKQYMNNVFYRDNMQEALTDMFRFPKVGLPWEYAGHYYVYKNDGLQNQSVLYVKDHPNDSERILLDPNTLSENGLVSLNRIGLSKDGTYIAYMLSTSGSDWNEIHVKTIAGEELTDVIKWVKFSNISWYKDGFFYSCYEEPTDHTLSQQNKHNKVYYHKVGTSQEKDILIYENKEDPFQRFSTYVPDEETYVVLFGYKGTSGNTVFIRSLDTLEGPFTPVVDHFEADYGVIESIGDEFYLLTNHDAPNGKVVKFNAKDATITFEEVIPEMTDPIENVVFIGEKIVTEYLHNAASKLCIYSQTGQYETDIPLPTLGEVSGISGNRYSDEMFYSFTSFTVPRMIYRLDLSTLKQDIYYQPSLPFSLSNYVCEQVFYPSKDGTMIPMFIVYKEGIKKDGSNPLLLYGYGGFNVSLTPSYLSSEMLFLENNGIYVQPNLRGGGEFGEAWHQAGTKLHKQNVFDDFIAAAEYLIEENYTSPEHLAIMGESNGGLLVGACMTQRPDLFAVALPAVGVMDMLKYHKFTIGHAWVNDYGSSENETEFHYLLSYSPLHNVQEGIYYPATLITTGDHDDRVVPAHSYKFAATLQEKHEGEKPILIRIDTEAGHGNGKPLSKIFAEQADIWAFTFHNLGMSYTNPITLETFDHQDKDIKVKSINLSKMK
ncbi:MAG: S9 family peptidase [Bacilli bacterium]|nr:S9 family peptidase [Bacilli bacterium]